MKHPIPIQIHANGTVLFEGRKCSMLRSTRGYHEVRIPLHRLVAHVFHGPPPDSRHVCHHKDGNPRNNNASNLCWLSQAENTRLHFAGRPRKLTEKQVNNIKEQDPGPLVRLRDLAEAFGVSYSAVRAVRAGINWKTGRTKSNRAILNAQQIEKIRNWSPPVITAARLARKYHVSDSTILSIWRGRY